MPLSCPPLFAAAALALLLPVLPGCEHKPPDELADAVTGGERAVAMQGTASFFDGKVSAQVTISRGIGRGLHLNDAADGGSGRKSKGNFEADQPNLGDMTNEEANVYLRSKGALGSPISPVSLHLKLTDHSPDSVSVEIVDFNSDLGNFVVSPATIKIAPSETSEPNPMVSQLGVTADRIPVTVTLRLGLLKETQSVIVTDVAAGAAPLGK